MRRAGLYHDLGFQVPHACLAHLPHYPTFQLSVGFAHIHAFCLAQPMACACYSTSLGPPNTQVLQHSGVMPRFDGSCACCVRLLHNSFFVPLIMGHGGNTGSQAVSTVIRALALRQIPHKDVKKVLWKETLAGGAMGACAHKIATSLRMHTHSVLPPSPE